MSMQDPIADLFTRIRNAHMAELRTISVPFSNMKEGIAKVLKSEGYIEEYATEGEGISKSLCLRLKYYQRQPVIEGIRRISKPSCRVYCGATEIPRVRNGLGSVILSTSHGLLSDREAKKENVGGEILCYVW